jgi:hypothetical protein
VPPSREAKPKAAKKVLSKEEKGVETAKRRGQRKNLKESNAAAAAAQHVEVTQHIAWQVQLKAGAAQVGLRPSLAEAMLLVKQEWIIGVALPTLSVSSLSSQLCPGMPAPLQVHTASRFASGTAPVHFNGTPRSGDSFPGATQKMR